MSETSLYGHFHKCMYFITDLEILNMYYSFFAIFILHYYFINILKFPGFNLILNSRVQKWKCIYLAFFIN